MPLRVPADIAQTGSESPLPPFIEQYADKLVTQYTQMGNGMPQERIISSFLGAKASLLGESSLSVTVRRTMLESYRLAELRLFGKIIELPFEQELLQQPLTEAVQEVPSIRLPADTKAALRKEPFAVSLRRLALFIVELLILYFFIWLPWRPSRASFLLFFGAGMIQVAATYALEWNPAVIPPLFMNSLVRVFVGLLAITTFVIELVVGFGNKPWWEALLLPLPPLVIASVWYKSRNPAPPFFTGIIALLLAYLVTLVR